MPVSNFWFAHYIYFTVKVKGTNKNAFGSTVHTHVGFLLMNIN